ncbi:MAG: glycerol kinase GlpK [Candidatus Heimdallarchaeota archaeon]|nr:glycerol kinase GlpK [Candidatus Heimdallarchaeota archaeon]
MDKFILSIDQGTSSTRSIVFNQSGHVKGSHQIEHRQFYPHQSWVEHDPSEIKHAVESTIQGALMQAKVQFRDIGAIGVTNQRETIVAWDSETGTPLHNAIVWQCRRSADLVEGLKKGGYGLMIRDKTGLVLDAYFSATKIQWLIENVDKIASKLRTNTVHFGTIDSWIINFLTGSYATDASNASRTMLYNINSNEWDEELLELFGVPIQTLPEVIPNASDIPFGTVIAEGVEIPIRGVLGDQQSALFGHSAFHKGQIKTTYGTGNFCLLNTGADVIKSSNSLISTIGWQIGTKTTYVLEGSVFVTGAALRWLRDELEIFTNYSDIDNMVSKEKISDNLFFVPAFVGLGAPYWDSSARGTIIGITGGTTKENILHATLASIVYQTEELISLMQKDTGIKIQDMNVDGGITNSHIAMQLQADISQLRINLPQNTETTALGAAMMAGLNLYFDNLDELKHFNPQESHFTPAMLPSTASEMIKNWKRAVQRSLAWQG